MPSTPFHYNKATPTTAPATMSTASLPNPTTPAPLDGLAEEEAEALPAAAVSVAPCDNVVPLTAEVSNAIPPVPAAEPELNTAAAVVDAVELAFMLTCPEALPVAATTELVHDPTDAVATEPAAVAVATP
jgi:hypothetical protein